MMAKGKLTRRGALAALGAGAAAACSPAQKAPAYEGAVTFSHGVASGDPGLDRVVIWTRVTPAQNGPVPVRWIVARDKGLNNVVLTGVIETTELRDYTVKVEPTGLRPGAPYFYGFLAGDQKSPVGKTRTLPQEKVEDLTFAVVSCASFPHGFFNAYDALAKRDDVDVVLHLGDYLYEDGLGGFGGNAAVQLGRIPTPEIECLSLADYRQRHAQYKAEPELQAAHALCPWIVTWDDHEFSAGAWTGGAGNHTPEGEGTWAVRKRNALQAYYEWMPIRDPEPGKPLDAINRVFQFGDLLTLCMLETRLMARTQPFDASTLPLYSTPWDFSDANAPRPVSPAASYPAHVRLVPVPYENIGGRLVPIWQWARVQAAVANIANPGPNIEFAPDRARIRQMLDGDDRTLLGAAQEEWLSQQFIASHRRGIVWQVLGSQPVMADIATPDLTNAPAHIVQEAERQQRGAARLVKLSRFGLPLMPDAWSGYRKARARMLAMFRQAGGNALVLSGESGAAWANELAGPDGQRIAVEFGAPSVTTPSFGDLFAGFDVDGALRARSPEVKWTDQRRRGFLLLTLTKENARAEFHTVSTIASKEYETSLAAAFTVRVDDTPGVGALTRA
jgi:alkaline phosphatase D